MDRFIGKRLDGRYEIQEIIGIGGMAVVYKAYDNRDGRIVAIKILKEELLQNQEFRHHFRNESKAIAVLNHPNIVKVLDVSLGEHFQYIVMEYIDGVTLKEYIERQKVIRWKDALHFTVQILRALQHAHDKGIIHRDIKPQNIMLLQNGTIKVTDFGIARLSRGEHQPSSDKAIGSVHYISPEQARGDFTDGKADIYSVGVMLYEMLTGRVPFDAENAVSVALMQLQKEAVPPRSINSNIPEGLEEITVKSMQKDSDKRYQSAAEMLRDIEIFKQNPSIQFEYKYFVDEDPTKHVHTIPSKIQTSNKSKPQKAQTDTATDDDEPARSPIVPILLGIASAFMLVMIIVAFFVFGNFFGLGPCAPSESKAIDCPNLVGKNYNEVIKDSNYSQYTIIQGSSEYSSEYAAGIIMSQTPEAGRKIKGKYEIKVKISLGAKTVPLDDYIGMNISTVEDALKTAGIKYEIKEVYSEEYAKGIVVATNPMSGQPVAEDVGVVIYISKGKAPNAILVGDYVGSKEEDAKRAIEGDGLTVGSVSTDYSSRYPEGYVIRQSVTAGTTVDKGTSISIVISAGEKVESSKPESSNASSSTDQSSNASADSSNDTSSNATDSAVTSVEESGVVSQ